MGLRTLNEDGSVKHIVVDPPAPDVKRMKVTARSVTPTSDGKRFVKFDAVLDAASADVLEEGVEYYMDFFPVPEQAKPTKPKKKK